MPEKPSVPDELAPLVQFVGAPVKPDDVKSYGEYQEILNQSRRTRAIVESWEGQQNEERTLRRQYATWLMWAVTAQVVVANVAFFLIGFGNLAVPQWVASVFFGSVFAEVSGLAFLVVKYLFPSSEGAIHSLIQKL